jgi:hypothetical protein
MIKIHLIEDINRPGEKVKSRELTTEEQSTVIATVVSPEQVVYFQQGDEETYLSYQDSVRAIQENYTNMLNSIIANL